MLAVTLLTLSMFLSRDFGPSFVPTEQQLKRDLEALSPQAIESRRLHNSAMKIMDEILRQPRRPNEHPLIERERKAMQELLERQRKRIEELK